MKWVNSEVRGDWYACGLAGWAGELAEHTTGALPTYQVGIFIGYSRVHGQLIVRCRTCSFTFQHAQIFSHFMSIIYTIASQDSINDFS